MEVFVDFGMFELLAALGLAAASRAVYRRRWLAVFFMAWTVVAPVTVLFVAPTELIRWIGVACLVPAVVNVATIAMLMRRHDLAVLLQRMPPSRVVE